MTKKAPTRILIIDDHPLMRQGISELINSHNDFTVCGEVSDARQAVSSVQKNNPDAVLLDLYLNGSSGIEVLKNLKAQFPKLKVLVLSMHDESVYAPRALRAGAMGYIMKDESPDNVIGALRKVLANEVSLSPAMGAKLLNSFSGKRDAIGGPIDVLSDRELEIFSLLGQGSGTREIAEKLHLSIKTIESHRAHIKEKMNLENSAQLIRHAIQWVSSEGSLTPSTM